MAPGGERGAQAAQEHIAHVKWLCRLYMELREQLLKLAEDRLASEDPYAVDAMRDVLSAVELRTALAQASASARPKLN